MVRIERNTVTISADASGEGLHRRPWRTELGAAPLRTTMAAAMLYVAEWDPTGALLDPFCGSGTVAIEAALLARNRPLRGQRPFAFQWPSFQPGTWASVTGGVAAAQRSTSPGRLLASDRDRTAVAGAQATAERARVADNGTSTPTISPKASPDPASLRAGTHSGVRGRRGGLIFSD